MPSRCVPGSIFSTKEPVVRGYGCPCSSQLLLHRLVSTEEENKQLKIELGARHKLELGQSKAKELEDVHQRVKQAQGQGAA